MTDRATALQRSSVRAHLDVGLEPLLERIAASGTDASTSTSTPMEPGLDPTLAHAGVVA